MLQSLADTEFRGVGVAGATQAIAVIKKSHPRSILLDWTLPGGISGLNLLKALKADHATRHIPVIMISGMKRSDSEMLAIQQAGAEGFFSRFDLMTHREKFLGLLRDAVAKNKSPSKWRLVVVEDDVAVQVLIEFALERREFDIHFSSTGHEGCRLAQDLKPNLILLDMGLPDINGVEVCKILRANPDTKGIPILAMTGRDRTDGILESALRALGIEDYLQKPFGENELLLHISHLLKQAPSERSSGEILACGRVRIDVHARRVWVGERSIKKVGYKQFELLLVLGKNPDGVSREKLRSLIWSGTEGSNVMDVTVHRLRELLGFDKTEGILAIPDGYKLIG